MPALTPAEARARLGAGAWVDVRDEAEFERGHLPASASLPLATWSERRHEWPPPDAQVVIVAERPADARVAAARLEAAGHADVAWLEAPWSALGVAAVVGPSARVWRPAAFLESVLLSLPGPPRGRALDVACGGGRDAVFLALAGYDVEAWDRDAQALARAGELARRHGVALRTHAADLESAPPPTIPPAAFALVACFRYLHRPLFAALERAVAPGGHLVYETYRQGQERFGRPRRPRFLLRAGELERAFPTLEVLHYEEPAPPQGPVTARLLARRPPH